MRTDVPNSPRPNLGTKTNMYGWRSLRDHSALSGKSHHAGSNVKDRDHILQKAVTENIHPTICCGCNAADACGAPADDHVLRADVESVHANFHSKLWGHRIAVDNVEPIIVPVIRLWIEKVVHSICSGRRKIGSRGARIDDHLHLRGRSRLPVGIWRVRPLLRGAAGVGEAFCGNGVKGICIRIRDGAVGRSSLQDLDGRGGKDWGMLDRRQPTQSELSTAVPVQSNAKKRRNEALLIHIGKDGIVDLLRLLAILEGIFARVRPRVGRKGKTKEARRNAISSVGCCFDDCDLLIGHCDPRNADRLGPERSCQGFAVIVIDVEVFVRDRFECIGRSVEGTESALRFR